MDLLVYTAPDFWHCRGTFWTHIAPRLRHALCVCIQSVPHLYLNVDTAFPADNILHSEKFMDEVADEVRVEVNVYVCKLETFGGFAGVVKPSGEPGGGRVRKAQVRALHS